MQTRQAVRGWCLLAVLLAGCTTERPYEALRLPPSARLVEVESATSRANGALPGSPYDPDGGKVVKVEPGPKDLAPRRWSRLDLHSTSSLVPPLAPLPAVRQIAFAPRHVLVLSGGGSLGAFTAGVLKGWSAAGTRPQFDVVTGISTGALIAPFAFLGPDYDGALVRSYTGLQDCDIYLRRLAVTLLWSDSLADSGPLRRRIATEVTPELLARIARAHAQGRRLYVGTTNLDTKRLVVWDLGKIASSNHPGKLKLFRKVLLASASVPGLLPPVAIDVEVGGKKYTELHVDGGVSASLFLQPHMVGLQPSGQGPENNDKDLNVYVVVAGKLNPDPRPVARRLFRVAGESLEGVLHTRFEGDLIRTYLLSRFAGAEFRLIAVPDDFPLPLDSVSFDRDVMETLLEVGHDQGRSGNQWHHIPPALTAAVHRQPRGGVRFVIQKTATKKSPSKHRRRTSLPLRRLFQRVVEDLGRVATP